MTNDELRRLAEAATPGPFSVLDMREPGGGFEAWLVKPCDEEKDAQRIISMSTKADADYCAAIHPQQTLALLDEIERLRKAIEDYAHFAPIDLNSPREVQDQLLFILGKKHTHYASINSDQCFVCKHDLRHEIHRPGAGR